MGSARFDTRLETDHLGTAPSPSRFSRRFRAETVCKRWKGYFVTSPRIEREPSR